MPSHSFREITINMIRKGQFGVSASFLNIVPQSTVRDSSLHFTVGYFMLSNSFLECHCIKMIGLCSNEVS